MQASFEPTDLAALTRDLASNFRSAIERAGLRFEVESPGLSEPVYVDPQMWEKIVLNLLSNAFKFTFDGSIAVRLQRQQNEAVLEIADTGVGIPDHEVPRLFERFHRVEGTAGRTQEGSGIGLALVQELVKLHGGKIHAASKLGAGTTFGVRLPFGTAHLAAEHIKAPRSINSTAISAESFVQEALRWTPGNAAESSAKLAAFIESPTSSLGHRFAHTAAARIVLADDNADMRDYIRDLLSPTYSVDAADTLAVLLGVLGNETQVAFSGKEALERLQTFEPDVMLLDIGLPEMNGYDLARRLRADPRWRDIRLVALTGYGQSGDRQRAREAGFDDHLIKPVDMQALQRAIAARSDDTAG